LATIIVAAALARDVSIIVVAVIDGSVVVVMSARNDKGNRFLACQEARYIDQHQQQHYYQQQHQTRPSTYQEENRGRRTLLYDRRARGHMVGRLRTG
jgi:hypothetical protein